MATFLNPYYGLLALLVALIYPYEHADEKNKRRMMWLLLALFTLFFGLRGNVGDDYHYYHNMYNHEAFFHLASMPLFALAMEAFKALHIPFEGFIFACSCLINALLFRFMSRQPGNLPFLLSIFVGLSGVVNEIDFIRNTISILLFANSWYYIQQQQPRQFYLLNIAGALVHYSALVYLPFYYLARKTLSPKVYLGIILGGVVIYFLYIPFLHIIPQIFDHENEFTKHVYTYIHTYTRAMGFTIAFVERLLTALLIYLFYEELLQDRISRTAVYAFVLYFISYTLLSNYAILGTRVANLFIPCYWVLWPALLRRLEGSLVRTCALGAIYFYLILRLLTISLMPQWHYTTIFGA